jgi:hypothetical protein
MTTTETLEHVNADLRAAVEARLAVTTETPAPAPAIPVDWILQGEAELKERREAAVAGWKEVVAAAEPAREAVRGRRHAPTIAHHTLEQAIAAVDDRHQRYGPPTEHFARTAALVNAAFGTSFTPADWALVMVLDKVARQRGPAATDDAAIDIAGYAACHQECRRSQP